MAFSLPSKNYGGFLSLLNWKACFPSGREGHFGPVFLPGGRAQLYSETLYMLHLSKSVTLHVLLFFSFFNRIDLNLQKNNASQHNITRVA